MELKKTNSTIFIVPTLKIERAKLINNNFINAYIKDIKGDVEYENSAYLLFKPKDLDYFKDFVDGEYERTHLILDDYDYDGGYVVLVYTLDPNFAHDFELVKKGKYSKTSQDFQELFPRVIKILKNKQYKEETSLQYRIFNKTDDLRRYWEDRIAIDFRNDMEVWEGWTEENEVLDIDKIKELV
jgi:hypothetical protein